MKRFYKLFACWVSALLLVFSPSMQSHASLESLLIRTDSNALMTMELDDSDYSVMPMSSIVNITNTINPSGALITFSDSSNTRVGQTYMDSGGNFAFIVPSGKEVSRFDLYLYPTNMPSGGTYRNQLDFSSDSSLEYTNFYLYTRKSITNASPETSMTNVNKYVQENSGDCYWDFIINVPSGLSYYCYNFRCESVPAGGVIGGMFKVSFTRTSADPDINVSSVSSSQDYQNDVSSSLSDLSSSVDEVSDEIGFVAEAIQNLQGAMEPHYSNVLTQLHHITEQLHAFYDQIYNNIHLKEYALWQDIKTAIENIDLEVNVNLDKLKTSIDNMSQAIQNKLQSVQDTLTNGFDNSGINQDAAELDQSLQEYEEAEQTVIDQVNDSLNDFEFDSGFEEYTNTIKVFSDFIQDLYEASGGFKVVINLSLMLLIAGIVIGVYRFRDGG